MNLPTLNHPELYQGLYVFDFGGQVAVGYTAEEIEVLLGSLEFKDGRAYKIHHATAAGELSLRGLSRLDVNVREGMVFYRASADAARVDFEALKKSATVSAPPAVLHWRLGSDSQAEYPEYTGLSYSVEASDQVGRWLEAIGFAGGDQVEAGHSSPTSLPSRIPSSTNTWPSHQTGAITHDRPLTSSPAYTNPSSAN